MLQHIYNISIVGWQGWWARDREGKSEEARDQSNRGAVGHALAGEAFGGVGIEKGVRHLGRAPAVEESLIIVAGLDVGGESSDSFAELLEGGQHLRVGGPVEVLALAQVLLVGGVGGQDLNGGHHAGGDRWRAHRRQQVLFWVPQQVLVLRRAGLRHQLPGRGRPVGHVALVGELAEVDGCVVRACNPNDGGEGVRQALQRVQLGPPGLALEIPVPHLHHLLPPGLQLSVLLHRLVRSLVHQLHVLTHPVFDHVPEFQPVFGEGIVLDHQLHSPRVSGICRLRQASAHKKMWQQSAHPISLRCSGDGRMNVAPYACHGNSPGYEVLGQSLSVESPLGSVHHSGHLHAVSARSEVVLDDAVGLDERLPRSSVYVHGVSEVRKQQNVDGVDGAQLPVGCYDDGFHGRVRL